MITIYTDGAYRINQKVGGWAFIMNIPNIGTFQFSGATYNTTNNRMELEAVLQALYKFHLVRLNENLSMVSDITVYSDSQYVVNAANIWAPIWRNKGFQGKKNIDLWKEYLELSELLNIRFVWIKGHSGNKYNELCDSLAEEAIQTYKRE